MKEIVLDLVTTYQVYIAGMEKLVNGISLAANLGDNLKELEKEREILINGLRHMMANNHSLRCKDFSTFATNFLRESLREREEIEILHKYTRSRLNGYLTEHKVRAIAIRDKLTRLAEGRDNGLDAIIKDFKGVGEKTERELFILLYELRSRLEKFFSGQVNINNQLKTLLDKREMVTVDELKKLGKRVRSSDQNLAEWQNQDSLVSS